MFGFGENKTETQEGQESSTWSNKLSEALADARSRVSTGKKRTEKGDGNNSEAKSGASVSRSLAEQAKKLFDPDAWRAIVRAPFALGRVVTGRDCWELDKKQEDTLATSTSMTAEYFMAVDPKYVALTICMFNWSVVLTEKYAANMREKKQEQKNLEGLKSNHEYTSG